MRFYPDYDFEISPRRISLVALILFAFSPSLVRAAELDIALDKSGIQGGLAVHIGATDGAIEARLTNGGRVLAHSLALDDTARDTSRAALSRQGMSGLATVVTWQDRSRLPYADNLVNLIVLDRDSLGDAAPTPEEVLRVVAPYGIVLERQDGQWRTEVKPRPAAMDDWTHFDYSASGSTCSSDTAIRPARQLQWITQAQPNPFEGNPAGYEPGAGVRIWQRYAVLDINDAYAAPVGERKADMWSLQCRDAFNGTPLWTIRRGRQVGTRRWSLVADDGLVFTYLKAGDDLSALDIATGKVKHTFAGTASAERSLRDETHCLRYTGKDLIVTANRKLLCFDPQTGQQRWELTRDDRLVLAPAVDAPTGRIYALVAKQDPTARRTFGGRWPSSTQIESVIAVDIRDGKLLWENNDEQITSKAVGESKGKTTRRGIGQVVPCGDYLIAYCSKAISGGQAPFIASLDARTGKTVHATDTPYESKYNVAGYNLLVRGDKAFFAGAFTNIWQYDPATGKFDRTLTHPWNQRCTRLTGTDEYLLFGQAGYFPHQGPSEQVTVARSGCAVGIFPANGLSYFTPNACGCITQLRGFNALTGETAPQPWPDTRRLIAGDKKPAVKILIAEQDTANGPVAADWNKQWRISSPRTKAVRAGDLELVAVVHEHRLEARLGDRIAWTFVADGRFSSPPLIVGDLAVFGDLAGWVYAVKVDDGALQWKHFVAPAQRLIGSNGQLENAWPVYGVALMNDQIIASAGTHVGIGGGVWVTALRPATGQALWRKNSFLPANEVPAGGKGAKIISHSFVNSAVHVDGDKIVLGDGGRQGGEFRFDPTASEQQLNEQLRTPKAK